MNSSSECCPVQIAPSFHNVYCRFLFLNLPIQYLFDCNSLELMATILDKLPIRKKVHTLFFIIALIGELNEFNVS